MRWLVRVTPWEGASLWRRLPCAFARVAALIAVLTILLNLLGPPIGIFVMARLVARKVPDVSVTPRPLVDYSVSHAPGRTLSYFGYDFEVPWNADFKTKVFRVNLVQIQFDSGRS